MKSVILSSSTFFIHLLKTATNYYQTNWDSVVNGSILSLSRWNTSTNLSNIEANDYKDFYDVNPTQNLGLENLRFWHTDIDELLAPYISNSIN